MQKAHVKKTIILMGFSAIFVIGFAALIFQSVFPVTLETLRLHIRVRLSPAQYIAEGNYTFLVQKNFRQQTESAPHCILMIHDLGDDETAWAPVLLSPAQKEAHEYLVAVRWPTEELMSAFRRDPGELPQKLPLSSREIAHTLSETIRKLPDAEDSVPRCGQWTVIGHGLGTRIALWLALDTSWIDRLLLVSPPALAEIKRSEWRGSSAENLKKFYTAEYEANVLGSPRRQIQILGRLQAYPVSYFLDRENSEISLLRSALPHLKATTFVLTGTENAEALQNAERLAQSIPLSVFQKIENCGYFAHKFCSEAVLKSLRQLGTHGAF